MSHLDDAVRLVRVTCIAGTYPQLDDGEVTDLVLAMRKWVPWQAATAYEFGDVVRPTVANGHVYRCITAGTSDTVEPVWPLSAPNARMGLSLPRWYAFTGPIPESQVADGATLVWAEYGIDDGRQYDTRGAIYQGWLLKAAKAAADYDVTTDQDSYSRSQVIEHCQEMADRYTPTRLA